VIPLVRSDVLRALPLLVPAGVAGVVALVALLAGTAPYLGQGAIPAYRDYVVFALGPLALLAVRLLVVRDLLERRPEAVEHLPVRWRAALAAKVVVGAAALAALVALGALMTSGTQAVFRQEPDPELAWTLARGGAAFVAVVYAGGLLVGVLGRHRHAAALALAALGLAAWGNAAGGVLRWAPVRLAREQLVAGDAVVARCAWLAAGLAALALVPVVAARGRLVRAWAGRVGRRDAVVLAGLAAPLAVVAVLVASRPAPAFALAGDVVRAGPVAVRVPGPDVRPRADAVAALASDALAALPADLGLAPPPVAVELGRGLDAATFERARFPAPQPTVLARANFLAHGFADRAFAVWVRREALDRATEGRLGRGPWRLLLDGYPLWRELADAPDGALAARTRLRAAWAAAALQPSGVDPAAPGGWARARRRLGAPLAAALAAFAMERLEARRAGAASELVARAAARRAGPWAGLRGGGLAGLLEETGGVAADAWWRDVGAAAEGQAERHAEALAGVSTAPAGELRLEPRPGRGDAWLVFSAGPGPGRFALLHAAVEPEAAPGDLPAGFTRDEAELGAGPIRAGPYPSGSRLLVTFARSAPALGCDVVSGWREVEVP